jgi:hypothetical protein
VQQQATGPEYYDIVVVPHSAIVVPLDEFDIPMPDRAPNCLIRAGGRIGDPRRTRAQIESTQIVRPRPDRTRGEPVERARGTGDR